MLTDIRNVHRPAQVLLLIDQPVLAEYIALALSHASYQTRVVRTADETVATVLAWPPHLAIIDMDLANGAILEHLGYTSSSVTRVPVVALTRRGDLATKLAAFDAGVDDILTIPFAPDELIARMLVIMRRTYRAAAVFTPVLRLGDLEIDIVHRRVLVGESALHLTAVEQSLLYLLAANAGRVVTRDEILDTLWGPDYVAESNVVERHVRSLRREVAELTPAAALHRHGAGPGLPLRADGLDRCWRRRISVPGCRGAWARCGHTRAFMAPAAREANTRSVVCSAVLFPAAAPRCRPH